MEYLTPIERMIIESLNQSPKSLESIALDLEIRKDTLFFILQRLVLKDFILYQSSYYQLNMDKKSDILIQLKDKSSKKFEIKSILESAKDRYLEHQDSNLLQVRKAYLNSHDLVMVESLMSQMQTILSRKERTSSADPLATKKIFYWGSQSYSDVLKYLEFS